MELSNQVFRRIPNLRC